MISKNEKRIIRRMLMGVINNIRFDSDNIEALYIVDIYLSGMWLDGRLETKYYIKYGDIFKKSSENYSKNCFAIISFRGI